jgi:hypothetical protein
MDLMNPEETRLGLSCSPSKTYLSMPESQVLRGTLRTKYPWMEVSLKGTSLRKGSKTISNLTITRSQETEEETWLILRGELKTLFTV